jgi:hypothetical protein
MAETIRDKLKNAFSTGKIPSQTHFDMLITSSLNQEDDGIKKNVDEPLTLTANIKETGATAIVDRSQKVLQFVKLKEPGTPEDQPSWLLNVASMENMNDDEAKIHGLNIVDAVANQSRLFIDEENGRIGIGTIKPNHRLTIDHTGWDGIELRRKGDNDNASFTIKHYGGPGSGAQIRQEGNMPLRFYTNGAERVRISGTGKVGIGTDDPKAPIHVKDTLGQLVLESTNRSAIYMYPEGSDKAGKVIFGFTAPYGAGQKKLKIWNQEDGIGFYAKELERLYISPDGDIGMGTNDPKGRLHIKDNITELYLEGSNRSAIRFYPEGISGSSDRGYGALGFTSPYSDTNNDFNIHSWEGGISFQTRQSVKMYLNHTGNLGIGTNDPKSPLHIRDNIADLYLEGSNRSALYLYPEGRDKNGQAAFGFTSYYTDGAKALKVSNKEGGITFVTQNIGRVYITKDGDMGIGTNDPKAPIHVKDTLGHLYLEGSNRSAVYLYPEGRDKDGQAVFGFTGPYTTNQKKLIISNKEGGIYFLTKDYGRIYIAENGRVGIGTVNPSYKLDVTGIAHATSFPSSSDKRFKKSIKPLKNVLDKISQLQGIRFEWNKFYESMGRSTGSPEYGFIAQNVKEVFPELVSTWGDKDYLAVDYSRFAPVLLEGIKALNEKIEALDKKIKG